MQDLQWNSGSFSTGIFLKREGGLPARCRNLPHSASIRSNSLSKMCSRMPSWARTSLAIVGRWPPARACPSLHRLCSTTLEYGSDHDGVDTVICWSMRHRLMKLYITLWTCMCIYLHRFQLTVLPWLVNLDCEKFVCVYKLLVFVFVPSWGATTDGFASSSIRGSSGPVTMRGSGSTTTRWSASPVAR